MIGNLGASQPVSVETGGCGSIGRWGCAHVQVAQELRAIANLERQGYEVYFPKYLRPSKSNIADQVERPLFPGYVFISLDLPRHLSWHSINGTYGVIRLLTTRPVDRDEDPRPMLLRPGWVERMRGEGRRVEALPANTVVRVRQRNHVFFDLVGTVLDMSRSQRVSVLMHLMCRDTVVVFENPADLEVVA